MYVFFIWVSQLKFFLFPRVMNLGKDILFYSNYSPFCKEVINHIVKRGARPNFIFICVDTNKNRLPAVVTSVPTLLTGSDGKVVIDDAITRYIDSRFESDDAPLEHVSSAYSDSFSFLDDSHTNNAPSSSTQFASFGNEQRIQCVDDGGDGAKPDKEHLLDRYMSDRDKDIKTILMSQQRT
jgi:hypothetical protein